MAFFSRPKKLILIKFISVLFINIIVARTNPTKFVLLLFSLFGKLVLIGLEIDFVEKWTDTLRFKCRGWHLFTIYLFWVVFTWPNVTHTPYFYLSIFSKLWPNRSFHFFQGFHFKFLLGQRRHFNVVINL